MATLEPGNGHHDPGIRLVLEELRDLRVEMRADRQRSDDERRRSDEAWREERRRADEERQQADEAWREERRRADEERWRWEERWREERRQADERLRQERLESEERFQAVMRDFREDSLGRETAMQKGFSDGFKQVHTVGLAIVRTLNRHTVILERIDRRLAGNNRRGRNDGRGR